MLKWKPRRRTVVRLGTALATCLLALGFYASTFVVSYGALLHTDDPLLISDVAGLVPAYVARVDQISQLADLRIALQDARERGLKVSISGSQHSQ